MKKIADHERTAHFMSKVRKNGCWQWQESLVARGYGRYWMNGRCVTAHRAAYVLLKGDIPMGKSVLHTCDNRGCMNPDHLYLGDHKDNMDDCIRRGRHYKQRETRCFRGHEYTKENTKVLIKPNGGRWRFCLKCEVIRNAKKAQG